MFLAYIVYTFLLLLMTLSVRKVYNNGMGQNSVYLNKYVLPFFAIILVTLIVGYRYDVGMDYFTYEWLYFTQDTAFFERRYGVEYIFSTIYRICSNLNLSFNFALCVLNIIPLCVFYKTFRDDKTFAWIIVAFFLSGQLFAHLNIFRQSAALFILIYSTLYIYKRSFGKFLICIILAMGFHSSAILFLPFYFIPYLKPLIPKTKLQYAAFLATLLFSNIILDVLIDLMVMAMKFTPYGHYGGLLTTFKVSAGSGVGVIIKALTGLVLIYYSKQLSQAYSHTRFDIYYLIYFAGALVANVFGLTSQLLLRIVFLFDSFRFVVLGYLFYYLANTKSLKNQIVFLLLLGSYIAYFIGMIYLHNSHCSPYQFAIGNYA